MKLIELIAKVKEEKPTSFTNEKLTAFVNEVEADVQEQLGIEATERKTYDYETDKEAELLVGSPYSRLYVSYLKAQIDYAAEEYQSYENNQAQHIADFREFVDMLVREGKVRVAPKRFKNIF